MKIRLLPLGLSLLLSSFGVAGCDDDDSPERSGARDDDDDGDDDDGGDDDDDDSGSPSDSGGSGSPSDSGGSSDADIVGRSNMEFTINSSLGDSYLSVTHVFQFCEDGTFLHATYQFGSTGNDDDDIDWGASTYSEPAGDWSVGSTEIEVEFYDTDIADEPLLFDLTGFLEGDQFLWGERLVTVGLGESECGASGGSGSPSPDPDDGGGTSGGSGGSSGGYG